MIKYLEHIDPSKNTPELQAWKRKYKYRGIEGPLFVLPQKTISVPKNDIKFKQAAKVRDMYGKELAQLYISPNGVRANFTANCIAEIENLYQFAVEVAEAYKDKGDLTIWESSLRHAAQSILDRIINQKNKVEC